MAMRRLARRWVVMTLAVSVAGMLRIGEAGAGSLVAGTASAFDNIVFAVDEAESSHGADRNMWRDDPDGPQGPMQVSAAAAADVGGGDRFDMVENRMLGRAYLAHLYRHYANWPDAVAAYNWGPGNMDAWIEAGRPVERFPLTVSLYRIRVLYGPTMPFAGRAVLRLAVARPRRPLSDRRHPSRQSLAVERLYNEIIADSERAIR